MSEAASRIHGLSDADLVDAPSFADIWPKLSELLTKYEVWSYNVAFDQNAVVSSALRYKLDIPKRLTGHKHWHCVMLEFSRYYGEYSSYWQSDRWKDLGTACRELEVIGSGDHHRATGDALDALGVMKALAARGGTSPDPAPEERPTSGGSYDGW